MNSDSLWRQSIARRIATAYSNNPNIAAVILGGSTARGHADRYSDIELGVFWLQPPTDIERSSAIVQSGGHQIRLYPYDPIEEVWSADFTMGIGGSSSLAFTPLTKAHFMAVASGIPLKIDRDPANSAGRGTVLRRCAPQNDRFC